MKTTLRVLRLTLLAVPLLLAGCASGAAPAFPNLGVLRKQTAPTLNEAERKKAIEDLSSVQASHKEKAAEQIKQR